MMKKKLLLISIAVLALGMLSGCANGTYSDYITLGAYKGLEVELLVTEVDDEMVEDEIQMLIDKKTTSKEVSTAAVEGNSVNIGFESTVNGEEFDSMDDYEVFIGTGEIFEEIETALIGKKAGDTLTVDVVLPDDYEEEFAGETAEFEITVKTVSEVSVPELNDEFAKENGSNTVAEFREATKENLIASHEMENRDNASYEVLLMAMENATFNGYPQELYDESKKEYDRSLQEMGERYPDFDMSMFELSEDDEKEYIEEMVNEKMFVVAVAEAERLDVTPEEYRYFLSSNYEYFEAASTADFEKDYTKETIMGMALLDKVSFFLLDHAKITEVDDIAGEDWDMFGDDVDIEEMDFEDEGIDFEDEEFLDDDIEVIELDDLTDEEDFDDDIEVIELDDITDVDDTDEAETVE